jgi:hypothetical protein
VNDKGILFYFSNLPPSLFCIHLLWFDPEGTKSRHLFKFEDENWSVAVHTLIPATQNSEAGSSQL